LFTTSYASLPSDASKPAYIKVSGTATVSSGVLTLTGGRLVIGALASDTSTNATTASSTPGGIFNVIGNFQVYVDNNTTSSSASPHGANSKVYTALATSIVAGANTINWTLPDPAWSGSTGSFIMLRTESSTSVFINSFTLSCS
jgi:pectate lyase